MKISFPKTLQFATAILAALFSHPVLAGEVPLYDNIPETLPSFDNSLYSETGPPGIPDDQPFNAQPFMTGDRGNISSVGIYFINGGSASGSVQISLMDDNEGLPGKVIAELGEVDLDSLPIWNETNSIGEVITFDTPIDGLTPNTQYYIGFDNSGMVDPGEGFPATSYFNLHRSNDEGTREANPAIVRPNGEWEPLSDYVTNANFRMLRIMESDSTPGKVIWDNGEFDTVRASGSFSGSKACGDDFQLARNTVIGSVTVWAHDVEPQSNAPGIPVGEIDELDTFTGTLTVAIYRDGGDTPGEIVTTRTIENPVVVRTDSLAPVGEHIFRIHGDLSTPLNLPKGDYWIVFRNGTWLSPHEGDNDMVIRGTQSLFGSPAVNAPDPTAPGDWEDEFGTNDLAFQLHATPGFIGHDVSVYGRYYNHNNIQGRFGPPFLFGTEQVGPEVEFEPFSNDIGAAGGFDLDAFSIEIDESTLLNFENASGNINGYVFEDTNDTLPDFLSVTLDESVSSRVPSQILVSPNTIWVNDEAYLYGANEYLRLVVTFADERSKPAISLSPGTKGSMILEAPAEVGKTYQFERSSDLKNYSPIDLQFVAASPFVTTHLKPTADKRFYRLREVE